MGTRTSDISEFYVVGINYKKTDAALRGQFAISEEQYARLLALAPSHQLSELFVLSTCNRTEIYGQAHHRHESAQGSRTVPSVACMQGHIFGSIPQRNA